jgi:hypothetical protein
MTLNKPHMGCDNDDNGLKAKWEAEAVEKHWLPLKIFPSPKPLTVGCGL